MVTAQTRDLGRAESDFQFILPRAASSIPAQDGRAAADPRSGPDFETTASFSEFASRSEHATDSLPANLRNSPVTRAYLRALIKASALAQLNYAMSSSADGRSAGPIEATRAQVEKYPVPARLTHSDLKNFAALLSGYALTPNIEPPTRARASRGNVAADALPKYFTEYYEGKFVDRFGVPVKKPSIASFDPAASGGAYLTVTLTDADITAAESVLIEYLGDLLDPTPILGDAANRSAVTNTTKFWPGGDSKSRPTAFDAGLGNYMQITENGCGVNTSNVKLLTDVADAASDRAALVGGLVANSPGGISLGLGVVGKLSIGDNQTLSVVVKTAAARFTKRLAYAGAFWALQSYGAGNDGRAVAEPTSGYLSFKGN